MHTSPIPRLGGVAIAFGLAVALGMAVIVDALVPSGPRPDPRSLLPVISGAALVFAMGLWDDSLDPVEPMLKILVETAAASIVIAAGLMIIALPFSVRRTNLVGWQSQSPWHGWS